MAVVMKNPVDMWKGTQPTIRVRINITGAGEGRVFWLRFGALDAPAYLQKTMSETPDGDNIVICESTLTEAETKGMPNKLMDFQVISSSPLDVLLEGKFNMKPMIRPLAS